MELSPPVLVMFTFLNGPSTEGLEWTLLRNVAPAIREEMNAYDNNTA
ncbi:hypothetical protein Tco_0675271, partial [Tanacetum coccineum]